jgi:hypothetical protein
MLGASQGWCVCLLIQQNYRYLTSSIAYTSFKTLAMASLRPPAGTSMPSIPPFFPASLLVLLITPPPHALPIVLRNDIPTTKLRLPHALRPALIALHPRSRNHHVQRTPVRVSPAAAVIIGEGDGLREVATEPGAVVEFAHFVSWLMGGLRRVMEGGRERERGRGQWESGRIYSGVVGGREGFVRRRSVALRGVTERFLVVGSFHPWC